MAVHRNAFLHQGGTHIVLGRKGIAPGSGHFGAKEFQGLQKTRSFRLQMEANRHSASGEGFGRTMFLGKIAENGHGIPGPMDFFLAPGSLLGMGDA